MKKNLLTIGLCLILGGVAAGVIVPKPTADTMEARGEMFGQGLTQLLCIVTGVILVIVHFARRKNEAK